MLDLLLHFIYSVCSFNCMKELLTIANFMAQLMEAWPGTLTHTGTFTHPGLVTLLLRTAVAWTASDRHLALSFISFAAPVRVGQPPPLIVILQRCLVVQTLKNEILGTMCEHKGF